MPPPINFVKSAVSSPRIVENPEGINFPTSASNVLKRAHSEPAFLNLSSKTDAESQPEARYDNSSQRKKSLAEDIERALTDLFESAEMNDSGKYF